MGKNKICRIKNLKITQEHQVEAPGGAAGRGRASLGANKTIRSARKIHRFLKDIE